MKHDHIIKFGYVSKMLIKPVLISIMLMSWTVDANAKESNAEKKANKATKMRDPIKCTRVAVTGSHRKQKICLKRSEWRKMTAAAQESARNRNSGVSSSRAE